MKKIRNVCLSGGSASRDGFVSKAGRGRFDSIFLSEEKGIRSLGREELLSVNGGYSESGDSGFVVEPNTCKTIERYEAIHALGYNYEVLPVIRGRECGAVKISYSNGHESVIQGHTAAAFLRFVETGDPKVLNGYCVDSGAFFSNPDFCNAFGFTELTYGRLIYDPDNPKVSSCCNTNSGIGGSGRLAGGGCSSIFRGNNGTTVEASACITTSVIGSNFDIGIIR